MSYHSTHDGDVEARMGSQGREGESNTLARVNKSEDDGPERKKGQDRGLHQGNDQHEHSHEQRSNKLQWKLIHQEREEERRRAVSPIRDLSVRNVTLLKMSANIIFGYKRK